MWCWGYNIFRIAFWVSSVAIFGIHDIYQGHEIAWNVQKKWAGNAFDILNEFDGRLRAGPEVGTNKKIKRNIKGFLF